MSSASNSSSHKLLSSRSPNKEAFGRISTPRCLEEILFLRLAKVREEAFFFENEEEEEEETKELFVVLVVAVVCCGSAKVVVVMVLREKETKQ